jgi:hypothetical protein
MRRTGRSLLILKGSGKDVAHFSFVEFYCKKCVRWWAYDFYLNQVFPGNLECSVQWASEVYCFIPDAHIAGWSDS